MKRAFLWMMVGLSLLAWRGPAFGQAVPGGDDAGQTPTLRVGTNLVVVPVSVRTKSGEPVFTLTVDDFMLSDDGVPQKIRLEEDSDAQPLALVVVVEAGDTPEAKFGEYLGLRRMINGFVGGQEFERKSKVAVVGFDSQAAVVQPWTESVDKAQTALRGIETGDGGAATLDAIAMAVELLKAQPPAYRRAILLVSETVDRGSHVSQAAALRAVSDSNTVIYSLGYSSTRAAGKSEAREALGGGGAGPPHGCLGKYATEDLEGNPLEPPADAKRQGSGVNNKAIQAFDCLALLAPPLRLAKLAVIAALNGFRANVPKEAAEITGGEYFKTEDAKSMEKDLLAIQNRLPNRYFLTFTPSATHAGLHAIEVHLAEERVGVVVKARTSYWEEAR